MSDGWRRRAGWDGMESKRNDEWLRAIALSLIQFHGYLRREKQRLVKAFEGVPHLHHSLPS